MRTQFAFYDVKLAVAPGGYVRWWSRSASRRRANRYIDSVWIHKPQELNMPLNQNPPPTWLVVLMVIVFLFAFVRMMRVVLRTRGGGSGGGGYSGDGGGCGGGGDGG